MKILQLLFTSFLIIVHLTGCQQSPDETEIHLKPNIIIIMADDMGYSDIGCFGAEIKTPHLDKLANEGMRLTQFYNAARCCPSRAALLTGLYPHQAGIGDMSFDYYGLPGYRGFLSRNSVTMAEVLSESGYHTMISGKWHAGHQEHAWPMKRGFDKQYASSNTTGHYFGVAEGRTYLIEDTIREPPGDWIQAGKARYKLLKNEDGSQWYATDAYTDRAIGYIRELRESDPDKPFFLYLPYTAPHWPLHAFEEDIQKYEGKYMKGWDSVRMNRYERLISMGMINPAWSLSEANEFTKDWESLDNQEKQYYDRLMAVYAAMIDRMDQNIGRLLSAITETGDIDNTVIMFLSDNGGCHEPVHRGKEGVPAGGPDSFDGYEYSWANASNTPFRWFKHWSHEGAISSPFIAWYPELIEPGQIDHQLAHIIDIMPTVCELTGTDYPDEYIGNKIIPVEGKSLVPILQGKQRKEHDFLCWEHEGNKAIRYGSLKLVSRFHYDVMEEGEWELYNLENDRTETENLAGEFPEEVEKLEKLYIEWAENCNVVPYKELRTFLKEMKQNSR